MVIAKDEEAFGGSCVLRSALERLQPMLHRLESFFSLVGAKFNRVIWKSRSSSGYIMSCYIKGLVTTTTTTSISHSYDLTSFSLDPLDPSITMAKLTSWSIVYRRLVYHRLSTNYLSSYVNVKVEELNAIDTYITRRQAGTLFVVGQNLHGILVITLKFILDIQRTNEFRIMLILQ